MVESTPNILRILTKTKNPRMKKLIGQLRQIDRIRETYDKELELTLEEIAERFSSRLGMPGVISRLEEFSEAEKLPDANLEKVLIMLLRQLIEASHPSERFIIKHIKDGVTKAGLSIPEIDEMLEDFQKKNDFPKEKDFINLVEIEKQILFVTKPKIYLTAKEITDEIKIQFSTEKRKKVLASTYVEKRLKKLMPLRQLKFIHIRDRKNGYARIDCDFFPKSI